MGEKDGYGWVLMKRGLLQKVFGWDERYVKWGITGAKSWAYFVWATEHESFIWGNGLVKTTDCYIAQEVKAIKERKKKKS